MRDTGGVEVRGGCGTDVEGPADRGDKLSTVLNPVTHGCMVVDDDLVKAAASLNCPFRNTKPRRMI
jgi:hypothetical protein